MTRDFSLGEFEQMLMLAILQLGPDSYGPDIAQYLETAVGRPVSRGALYATLGRLEEKGYLRWQLEEPDAERGGHRKRRFELTAPGVAALRTYRAALLELWSGLEGVLGSEGA
jgi:DNA-binding PadR family transcriptional regulator